jgi:hypothetical protein
MLHRYWFTFENSPQPSILNLGCGVTAVDEADARQMIEDQVYPAHGFQEIKGVVTDVDISTLDQGHVVPNMTMPLVRGVWFPRL